MNKTHIAARRYENATPPDGYDDDVPMHERTEGCSVEELPEVLRAIADRWRDGRVAVLPTGVHLHGGVSGGVRGSTWWCAAQYGALQVRIEEGELPHGPRDSARGLHLDELAADALDELAREVERTVRR